MKKTVVRDLRALPRMMKKTVLRNSAPSRG
jgi:hypothetical protein